MLVNFEVLAVFLGEFSTFSSLLDTEADATTSQIKINDLDPQLFAGSDNLLGGFDVLGAHF